MTSKNEEYIRAYRNRGINIPSGGDYVVVNTRSFGPGKILVVDLDEVVLHVYSPYAGHNLLLQRKLTTAESAKLVAIVNSKEYLGVPETTQTIGFDLHHVEIISHIAGREKRISHTEPHDDAVLQMVALYKELIAGSGA